MKFRRRAAIWIAILGAGAVAACAPWPYEVTPAIRGVVVDAASREPIAGAVVRIQGFPETAVKSGADGSFSIAAVREWQIMVIGTEQRSGFALAADASGYVPAVQLYQIGGLPEQVVAMKRIRADE